MKNIALFAKYDVTLARLKKTITTKSLILSDGIRRVYKSLNVIIVCHKSYLFL